MFRTVMAMGMVVLSACDGGTAGDDDTTDDVGPTGVDDTAEATGVTFHRDVRPILDARCAACHTEGGIGPFPVAYDPAEWTDGEAWWAKAAVASVLDGTMPPWMPDETCHPVADSRRMASEEIDVLRDWAAAGYPEGDPADAPGAKGEDRGNTEELGDPSLSLGSAEPYAPDVQAPDDYRCFVLDHTFDTDRWMTAFQVQPDQLDVVHHVILYRLDAEWADDVEAWDEADAGPGYTCFGSPGTWTAETLAGWAPGQLPEVYQEGTARQITAGSVLVMQVHYNVLNLDGAAPEDATALQLWLLPEGEKPTYQLISLPFADTDLSIAAGDPKAEAVLEVGLDGYLRRRVPIRGVFPHLHQLGTRVKVEVLRDEGDEDCVVDIPAWDFNWQQTYFFPWDDPIIVDRTDRLRLTCTYDNSAANQPVVNGTQLEPRDVTWGDGSLDEMCLAYLYVTVPVDPF